MSARSSAISVSMSFFMSISAEKKTNNKKDGTRSTHTSDAFLFVAAVAAVVELSHHTNRRVQSLIHLVYNSEYTNPLSVQAEASKIRFKPTCLCIMTFEM